MKLYHYTARSSGELILERGFRDSDAIPSLNIHAGVWLADVPTTRATTQLCGRDDGLMLGVDVPDEWATQFVIDGSPGELLTPGWREFCVPAALLNECPRYMVSLAADQTKEAEEKCA